MDWHRGPGTGEDAAAGVAELLARAQEELGGPLLGARFLYDARQMFAATREIERAVSAPGTTLYVGFQRAEKLDGEAPIYRDLTGQGVQVIAFGTGTPTEVPEVRWVRLPEDHGALASQWFLVTQTPEPIAFVGFETSPPDRIGEGGAADPARTWAGFVTDDPRLVGAIASHLHGLADRQAPAAPDGQVTAQSTMLLVATDDGTDPAYAVCRRAGLEVARREGVTVVLYDRSSESYLVDPYEFGPWTSQNHGPAGDRPLDIPELLRLGRRYLAEQVSEGRALGLQVGAWLARGTGPPAMAAACQRLGVDRVVLPDKLARPTLRDRVLGRTLADFQDRLSAKITLVNDQGASSTPDRPHLNPGRWRSGAVGGASSRAPACWRPVGAKTHDSRQRSGLSRSPCESKRIGACGGGTVRGDGGDGDEGYRFRIEADDGQLMATSEPYTSKSSALKGVEAIKRNAAVAQIDDESGDDQDATATPRAATPDA